jgi:hypothetical protein
MPEAAPVSLGALPASLTDAEFMEMSSEFSEPDGAFVFEMYMSNEATFQTVIPDLVKTAPQGGVYLGVAPEQNFTYIAALRPSMAFIIDIRRENLIEMLMYKALFELSSTRAEFLSRLFSRNSPESGPDASVGALFDALSASRADSQEFGRNLKAVKDHLRQKRGFSLNAEDLRTLEYIYGLFYQGGPDASLTSFGTSYRLLMRQTDNRGRNWNFLTDETNYQFVREMQQKNLIIPVVGNFAGPRAIQAVAKYLKEHNAVVSAFYVSNVEEYISGARDDWKAYCRNIAALPVSSSSLFIRFGRGGRGSWLNRLDRGC